MEQTDRLDRARHEMVRTQVAARGVTDAAVLAALRKVPRHRFVPAELASEAYADKPLAIGGGQTISQPLIVALSTQLAGAGAGKRALDVGGGSGYQAAVLAELCDQVDSIEIRPELAARASALLAELGYRNVTVHCADGTKGWPSGAPYDLIVVAAAAPQVPQPLIDQLAPGGTMVIPVGTNDQMLLVVTKDEAGKTTFTPAAPVRFVPLIPGD